MNLLEGQEKRITRKSKGINVLLKSENRREDKGKEKNRRRGERKIKSLVLVLLKSR